MPKNKSNSPQRASPAQAARRTAEQALSGCGQPALTAEFLAQAEKIAAEHGLTTKLPTAEGTITRQPEFVRVSDLRMLAGLKRGYCYARINDGTFRSITLREPGKKFGVRLVYWPSVKNWLHGLMEQQNQPSTNSQP